MSTENQPILPQTMNHDMTYCLASYRDQAEVALKSALAAKKMGTACRILVCSLYTPEGETGRQIMDGKSWPIHEDRLPIGLWSRLHSRVETLGGVHLYIAQGEDNNVREYGIVAVPFNKTAYRVADAMCVLLGSLAEQDRAMIDHWIATGYLLMGPESDNEHLQALLSWWARRTGSIPTGTRGPLGHAQNHSRPTKAPDPPAEEKVWGEWNTGGQTHDMGEEKDP